MMDFTQLDLKKLFDSVPHKKLNCKLEKCGGMRGNVLECMKDFNTNRKMRTDQRH